MPPKGYETMTVQQVKDAGIFPEPGQGIRAGVSLNIGPGTTSGFNIHQYKQARRVFVGNIPQNVTAVCSILWIICNSTFIVRV